VCRLTGGFLQRDGMRRTFDWIAQEVQRETATADAAAAMTAASAATDDAAAQAGSPLLAVVPLARPVDHSQMVQLSGDAALARQE
jgi:hypothetical protein